jgi:deoxyribonuclease-4
MSHDSYLINLGAPDPENLVKSRKCFQTEIERCLALGVTFLNFHPGASLRSCSEECMDRICDSLLAYEPLLAEGSLRLLFENTAGQGSAIGHRFEELAYMMEKVKRKIPIGICIDTCHAFAAGYDIRTAEGWDKTLQEFDRLIGLEHLCAFHVNDSAKPLGSRVDRHASLGKGLMGLESFKVLMTDERTRHVPKYLETPEGPPVWKEEIALLREFAKETVHAHKN